MATCGPSAGGSAFAPPPWRAWRAVLVAIWPAALVPVVFTTGFLITERGLPVIEVREPPAAVCDRVVRELLTTRDPVELRRATALAGLMRCAVARRMPPPEWPWRPRRGRGGATPG